MLRLNASQRSLLADKLGDVANLAAGALVLGQFVGGVPSSVPLAGAGIAAWLVLIGVAVALEAR
jgi:hypothetical protein